MFFFRNSIRKGGLIIYSFHKMNFAAVRELGDKSLFVGGIWLVGA